jgi:hypothetical protein
MDDSGAASRHAHVRDDTLASSPTIQNGLSSPSPKTWTAQDQRRASVASSLLSEDFENWPGFDSHDAFDDSGLGLEDQEKRDQFPGDANHNNNGDGMAGNRWLQRRSSDSDESDDPYSSAALSRRAEIILANAKKRLNVCVTWSPTTTGRLLTMTGHGGKPPRCTRVPCRLPHLQLHTKHVRNVAAYKLYARPRSQTVRRARAHTTAHSYPILYPHADRQPRPFARVERDLCTVAFLLALILDAQRIK